MGCNHIFWAFWGLFILKDVVSDLEYKPAEKAEWQTALYKANTFVLLKRVAGTARVWG
jgi:hypothetical protein